MFAIFRKELLAQLPRLIIPRRASPSSFQPAYSLSSAHLLHTNSKPQSSKIDKNTVTLIGSVHSKAKQIGKVQQFFFKTTNQDGSG